MQKIWIEVVEMQRFCIRGSPMQNILIEDIRTLALTSLPFHGCRLPCRPPGLLVALCSAVDLQDYWLGLYLSRT